MGINIQEAKISRNTYLFLHEGSEPPCLQMKEELLWGFIQAATGIETLKLFHLGPRWDPKILWPCLPNGISVLVLLVLELHSDDVH